MSLTDAYDADNIFAKILKGDIPCARIAETDTTLAFMDAFPQSRGHSLVIPKAPGATNILSVSPETLSAVMSETQRIAKAVQAALDPDGIRVVQFNGSAAGQTVFHLHFHVIPMWSGEPLGAHSGGMADMADLTALASQISDNL